MVKILKVFGEYKSSDSLFCRRVLPNGLNASSILRETLGQKRSNDCVLGPQDGWEVLQKGNT